MSKVCIWSSSDQVSDNCTSLSGCRKQGTCDCLWKSFTTCDYIRGSWWLKSMRVGSYWLLQQTRKRAPWIMHEFHRVVFIHWSKVHLLFSIKILRWFLMLSFLEKWVKIWQTCTGFSNRENIFLLGDAPLHVYCILYNSTVMCMGILSRYLSLAKPLICSLWKLSCMTTAEWQICTQWG